MIIPLLILVVAPSIMADYAAPTSPQYDGPTLTDNYACSIEGSYNLFGTQSRRHRYPKYYPHPKPNYCQNAIDDKSCMRCCRMAAILQGSSHNDTAILGFNVILEKRPFCICCAPINRNYDSNSGAY